VWILVAVEPPLPRAQRRDRGRHRDRRVSLLGYRLTDGTSLRSLATALTVPNLALAVRLAAALGIAL